MVANDYQYLNSYSVYIYAYLAPARNFVCVRNNYLTKFINKTTNLTKFKINKATPFNKDEINKRTNFNNVKINKSKTTKLRSREKNTATLTKFRFQTD